MRGKNPPPLKNKKAGLTAPPLTDPHGGEHGGGGGHGQVHLRVPHLPSHTGTPSFHVITNHCILCSIFLYIIYDTYISC